MGITQEEIDRITKGPKAGWNAHDAAILQAADDLFENSIVSDETWKTLSKTYNTQQMMDLVFTIGQYNLVSWALNSCGVPLDDYLPGAKKSVRVRRGVPSRIEGTPILRIRSSSSWWSNGGPCRYRWWWWWWFRW